MPRLNDTNAATDDPEAALENTLGQAAGETARTGAEAAGNETAIPFAATAVVLSPDVDTFADLRIAGPR